MRPASKIALSLSAASTLLALAFVAPAAYAQGLSSDTQSQLNDIGITGTGPDSTAESDQQMLGGSAGGSTVDNSSKSGGSDFLQNIRGGSRATAGNAGFGGSKTLPEFIGAIIKYAIGFTGVLMISLMTYGGFLWMTAQGEAEKIKKAKGIITSAVVGLAIVFAGYAITDFVVKTIDNAYLQAQ